ncbi:MAG: family 16 glycoside hydrolase [Phycisphaerales bacterium]
MKQFACRLWLCSISALGALVPVPVVAQPDPAGWERGVTFRAYDISGQGEVRRIPVLLENQTPNVDELRPVVDFTSGAANPADANLTLFPTIAAPITCVVRASIEIPGAGELGGDSARSFVFRLISDDGSRLFIDDREVIDHDGRHGASSKDSGSLELAPGFHPLRIEYFDSGGSRRLRLEWKTPGAASFTLVPASNFWTESDLARVTSPGAKRIAAGSGEGTPAPRTRPGDRRALEGVHPSFRLETIRTQGLEPRVGALCFDSRGRLIVGTFDPLQRTEESLPDIEKKTPDKLYAVDGLLGATADASGVIEGRVSVAADGLYEPCGAASVGDVLYVSHRRAVTRLIDRDADGFYETHEDVATGWEGWNYHQFNFGLVERNGLLYCGLATAMAPPKWEGMGTNAAPNGPMRGCVLEIDPVANIASVIAGGCRTPNGLGIGPGGSLFYCDNQGTWMPTSQMAEVVPGRFFGHFNNTNMVPPLRDRYPGGGIASAWCDRVRAPAALYLPQNECSNSPTQPLLIDTPALAPYCSGSQMLIGELTAGGIRRANLERVNGEWQGAAFRFSQGFSVGINRMAWSPAGDGALYVGGIGAGGNWNWKETKFGLQRLVPTGVVPFEMLAVNATPTGLTITFTKPVETAWLTEPKNFEVRQWHYKPTAEYGGPKIDDRAMTVAGAVASDDGRSVRLTIPGLVRGSCVYLHVDPKSASGETIWATEAWYTLNNIPVEKPTVVYEPARAAPRVVNDVWTYETALGVGVQPPAHAAVLIGRSARANFVTGARQGAMPTAGENRTQKDLLDQGEYVEMNVAEGDLTSRISFGDARLHVEWYCPPGGEGQLAANSGVYLQSLYEIQVLGTRAGAAPRINEAGSLYNVKAPDVNASTGPGTWQAYDVFFDAPRFERGVKVSPARLTLYWNGVLVHDRVEVSGPTGAAAAKGEPGPAKGSGDGVTQIGPLRLQAHETAAQGPVRYRNVWIAPADIMDAHSLLGDHTVVRSFSTSINRPERIAQRDRTAGPWKNLTDASGLGGWTTCGGGGVFSEQPGEIVGETRPNSPNTFLVSRETYSDFELLLEVKQDPELNSGIQFRSHVEGGIDNRSGRVVGYQCELDPAPRAFSGGIYDEGRRGWLAPLIDAPYARAAYKPGDWNTIRIVARGPVVQTWVNGVPAATMFDAMDAAGHIALQVHGVGDRADPLRVRFRNMRIRELR